MAFNYKYDRYGNRWQQNVTAGSGPMPQYNFDNNNHITPTNCTSSNTICYDVAGNLLQDTFHTYTYDAEGRILTVDGGATSYVYDAMGHRVQRTKAGVVSFFAYDLSGRDIAEYQTSVGVRFEGYAGARHIVSYSNNLTYLDLQDVVGTERAHITQNGSSVENTYSLPFGDGQSTTGSGSGLTGPTHFTGKERDSESNLDYFGARYYSSTIGRFLTPDWSAKPVSVPYAAFGNPQSLNLYAYVLNNPTTSLDPDGHFGGPGCAIAAGCNAYTNDSPSNSAEQQNTQGFAEALLGTPFQITTLPTTNIVADQASQTSTSTTSQSTVVPGVDANGMPIVTITTVSVSVTVSTADRNNGQVLGGSITQSVTTLDARGKSSTLPGPTISLTPLQAQQAVGTKAVQQLQDSVRPTFFQNLMNHKIGIGGAATGDWGGCRLRDNRMSSIRYPGCSDSWLRGYNLRRWKSSVRECT